MASFNGRELSEVYPNRSSSSAIFPSPGAKLTSPGAKLTSPGASSSAIFPSPGASSSARFPSPGAKLTSPGAKLTSPGASSSAIFPSRGASSSAKLLSSSARFPSSSASSSSSSSSSSSASSSASNVEMKEPSEEELKPIDVLDEILRNSNLPFLNIPPNPPTTKLVFSGQDIPVNDSVVFEENVANWIRINFSDADVISSEIGLLITSLIKCGKDLFATMLDLCHDFSLITGLLLKLDKIFLKTDIATIRQKISAQSPPRQPILTKWLDSMIAAAQSVQSWNQVKIRDAMDKIRTLMIEAMDALALTGRQRRASHPSIFNYISVLGDDAIIEKLGNRRLVLDTPAQKSIWKHVTQFLLNGTLAEKDGATTTKEKGHPLHLSPVNFEKTKKVTYGNLTIERKGNDVVMRLLSPNPSPILSSKTSSSARPKPSPPESEVIFTFRGDVITVDGIIGFILDSQNTPPKLKVDLKRAIRTSAKVDKAQLEKFTSDYNKLVVRLIAPPYGFTQAEAHEVGVLLFLVFKTSMDPASQVVADLINAEYNLNNSRTSAAVSTLDQSFEKILMIGGTLYLIKFSAGGYSVLKIPEPFLKGLTPIEISKLKIDGIILEDLSFDGKIEEIREIRKQLGKEFAITAIYSDSLEFFEKMMFEEAEKYKRTFDSILILQPDSQRGGGASSYENREGNDIQTFNNSCEQLAKMVEKKRELYEKICQVVGDFDFEPTQFPRPGYPRYRLKSVEDSEPTDTSKSEKEFQEKFAKIINEKCPVPKPPSQDHPLLNGVVDPKKIQEIEQAISNRLNDEYRDCIMAHSIGMPGLREFEQKMQKKRKNYEIEEIKKLSEENIYKLLAYNGAALGVHKYLTEDIESLSLSGIIQHTQIKTIVVNSFNPVYQPRNAYPLISLIKLLLLKVNHMIPNITYDTLRGYVIGLLNESLEDSMSSEEIKSLQPLFSDIIGTLLTISHEELMTAEPSLILGINGLSAKFESHNQQLHPVMTPMVSRSDSVTKLQKLESSRDGGGNRTRKRNNITRIIRKPKTKISRKQKRRITRRNL